MHRSYVGIFPSLILVLLRESQGQSVDTATVSITSDAAYSIQPACVQSCVFWNSFGNGAYLVNALGCESTVYNECYCTQIADQRASSELSGCVNTLCTGTTEISNAISLYENYCGGAGYPRTASTTPTPSTTASSPALQPASATPPSTSTAPTPSNTNPPSSTTSPLSTSSSSSTSSQQTSSSGTSAISNSKSKTGPIVGGVVGGLAALALIVAAIFLYLRSQRKKSAQYQHQEAAPAPPPAAQPEKPTERPVSPVSALDAPAAIGKTPISGRAELDHKENGAIVSVSQGDSLPVAEIQGEERHGIRPEELDANGRYAGELHGDGRHFNSSELP